MDYMVSAHGGRQSTITKSALPANVRVVFFIDDGKELQNTAALSTGANAWAIFNRLKNGYKTLGFQEFMDRSRVEVCDSTTGVYNYECWNLGGDLQANSGIFEVGDTASGPRINPLTTRTTLLDIIHSLPSTPTTIYWVACRSIL